MHTFIELFAGIGGFRLGLERSGWTCVWANEMNKYASQIYQKNFGGKELYEGDIRKVKTEDIPEADLLVGGFPCQSFSLAGKRKGFKDARGTLFFEIARIAESKRPKILLLENVKGLLSAQEGYCFFRIISVLDELGYDCEWQVLNSKHFGVPQNRERVFIIGHLRGTSFKQIFPIEQKNKTYLRDRTFQASTVFASYSEQKGGTYIIDKQKNMRFLTHIECERLQGFPDNWTEGISDTQRYKCLGNAVTVNIIEFLGKQLY